jgi:hypothetical protein
VSGTVIAAAFVLYLANKLFGIWLDKLDGLSRKHAAAGAPGRPAGKPALPASPAALGRCGIRQATGTIWPGCAWWKFGLK